MSWTFTGVTDLMASDAGSGQKDVVVVDGDKFREGIQVLIRDDNASETNQIDSISSNTLTMVNNLANSYTTAANGEVVINGEVTLPHDPAKVKLKPAADVKASTYPGELALLISMGRKVDVLTLEGWIYEDGRTKQNLVDDYIDTLIKMVHCVVTIAGPTTLYDGDWLMVSGPIQEIKGYKTTFSFKLELWKGFKYVVL